jgi:hypothetical protein
MQSAKLFVRHPVGEKNEPRNMLIVEAALSNTVGDKADFVWGGRSSPYRSDEGLFQVRVHDGSALSAVEDLLQRRFGLEIVRRCA